jgi:hypothetical protein
MILLALILAASANRLTLFDETVRLPRGQWRAINLALHQRPATVQCNFQVVRGRTPVRALIMTRHDVEQFRTGKPFRVMTMSEESTRGEFTYTVNRPGDYMVLIENSSRSAPVLADLKVVLQFNGYASFEPRLLSPEKRRNVLAVSLGGLLILTALVAWRLRPAIQRRRTHGPPPEFY